jgi:hypothetical protein
MLQCQQHTEVEGNFDGWSWHGNFRTLSGP